MKPWYGALLFAVGLLWPWSSVFAGTVVSPYLYAWSDEVGYINFENVVVSDTVVAGYAWSANAGWINFSPAFGGVTNDGTGNLSGFAWGEQLGWIDFGAVSIHPTTGRFSGTATGGFAGTITFDCPTYCDVRTDWREVVASSPFGGGGEYYVPRNAPFLMSASDSASTKTDQTVGAWSIPNHIDTHGQPLTILPWQSGTVVRQTPLGQVVLDVPANGRTNEVSFFIASEPLVATNAYLIAEDTRLVNDVFYDISAKDQYGKRVHTFSKPLTITLPIPPSRQKGKGLSVYWLNETNQKWVLIPQVVFTKERAIFQMNHLTKFAIFSAKQTKAVQGKKIAPAPSFSIRKNPKIEKPEEERKEEIQPPAQSTSTKATPKGKPSVPALRSFWSLLKSFLGF